MKEWLLDILPLWSPDSIERRTIPTMADFTRWTTAGWYPRLFNSPRENAVQQFASTRRIRLTRDAAGRDAQHELIDK